MKGATEKFTSAQIIKYFESIPGIGELPTENQNGEVSVCCPIHQDNNPSLSINIETGLWCCHAHCGGGDLYDFEMRLTNTDFKDAKNEIFAKLGIVKTKVKSYIYHDSNGHINCTIDRYEWKSPDSPISHGKWFSVSHIEDGKTVYKRPDTTYLYNLPAVMKSNSVLVVEGEKCADYINNLLKQYKVDNELVATCNPFGAGKWKEEYSQFLKDKKVYVSPDYDEQGYKHAREVVVAVQPLASQTKVVLFPLKEDGADLVDYLPTTKNPMAELLKLIENAVDKTPQQIKQEAEKFNKTGEPKETLVLTQLSTVERKEVGWLWHPYLPKGKLTMLEGDPAAGKTFLSLGICAKVTNGELLYDTGVPQAANVVYMTAEDDLGDTIRPRFEDMGGDLTRFYALEGAKEANEQGVRMISLADIDLLEQAIKQVSPALIVIDPLQAFLGANVDMYRPNEVRPLMAGLTRLAERYGTSIVVIRHLTKGSQSKAAYRGMGSIDFTAAARSVLLAGCDPNDKDKRAFVPTKASVAEYGAAQGYSIEKGEYGQAVFKWTGESTLTADEILAPAEEPTAMKEAEEFLLTQLDKGAKDSDQLKKAALAQNISKRTLWRAKAKLKIKAVQTDEKDNKWEWSLNP